MPPGPDGERVRSEFLDPIQEMDEFYTELERRYSAAAAVGDEHEMAEVYEEFDQYAYGPRQQRALEAQELLGFRICVGY